MRNAKPVMEQVLAWSSRGLYSSDGSDNQPVSLNICHDEGLKGLILFFNHKNMFIV